jgi:hypothetical protein
VVFFLRPPSPASAAVCNHSLSRPS